MTLGQRLLELRSKMGLSQDALADILSVSRQSVSAFYQLSYFVCHVFRRKSCGGNTDSQIWKTSCQEETISVKHFYRAYFSIF